MQNGSLSKNFLTIGLASSVVMAALAFLFWFALNTQSEPDTELTSADFGVAEPNVLSIPDGFGGLQVGDTAPQFELMDSSGEIVALSDFAGQAVMVNFWATWCAPCRIEMPEMQEAYEKYKEDGFVILALNQDEAVDTVNDFFYDEMNLTFTPLMDENSVVSSAFGVYGFNPSSFFIDGEGVIAGRHIGPVTAAQLDEYVGAILP